MLLATGIVAQIEERVKLRARIHVRMPVGLILENHAMLCGPRHTGNCHVAIALAETQDLANLWPESLREA